MHIKACAPNGNNHIQRTISALSNTAESMVDLRVLRDIEETVDELAKARNGFSGVMQLACDTEEKIRNRNIESGVFIDEDGRLEDGVRGAITQSEQLLVQLAGKKAAIDKDSRLRSHDREELHDAYNDAVDALALMIESLKDVLAALITHDLNAEPRDGKKYSDIGELLADLRR